MNSDNPKLQQILEQVKQRNQEIVADKQLRTFYARMQIINLIEEEEHEHEEEPEPIPVLWVRK